MAEKDGLTELAKLFKNNENKTMPSITTGIVEALPPNPVIRLSPKIAPDKTQLIFASNLISGYERKIKFTDTDCGLTTTENDGGMNAGSHNHGIELLEVDTLMQWTDTLAIGDEVIVIPVMDSQMYYVIDKAVKFE
ncbi:DUF2577 family protein [Sporosarcina sp. FSL K6-1508]|uniref:DUF2577 family protein n=1 Tax=Sporosarcina sp. FSL K6-1508 TaxID=2921553 RepID=UPI0030F4BBF0